MTERNNDKYKRIHIAVTPETFKKYAELKGKILQKEQKSFSDNRVIAYICENFKI